MKKKFRIFNNEIQNSPTSGKNLHVFPTIGRALGPGMFSYDNALFHSELSPSKTPGVKVWANL